jgi:hypothetical protein
MYVFFLRARLKKICSFAAPEDLRFTKKFHVEMQK